MILLRKGAYSWLFLLGVAGIYATALTLVQTLATRENGSLVALGLTLDLVVVVPALYWWLMVRHGGWPKLSVVPVILVSFFAASRILPPQGQQLLQDLKLLGPLLELVVLGVIAWQATLAVKSLRRSAAAAQGDALDAIRAAARAVLGENRLAEVLVFEIALLYYGLFSWASRGPADRPDTFTCYRRSSYGTLLLALACLMPFEIVPVHLLVARLWGGYAAWIVTALGIWGLVWVLGLFQALRLRPTRLSERGLELRVGLRWQLEVPFENVVKLERLRHGSKQIERESLDVAPLHQPVFRLELAEAVEVLGVYGQRRRARVVYFAVDEPERFERRFGELMG